jgi:ElaB/YqjD/DUF883 family membrane-anchored ribosome-binding protein
MNLRTHNGLARDADQMTRHLSDRVLQSAHEAVDSTRDLAQHALDSADTAVRRARGRIDPALEDIASNAQKLAHRSLDIASQTGARAQQTLRQYAAVTERYVADQPVRAILIAAAAGAVIAALAMAAASSARKRRENSHRSY